jgi:ribonuclease D
VICRPDRPAFDQLAKWRSGVARSMGVPAYRILGNGVLRAICKARPRSRAELARVKGVGPRVLAKFGDALLQLAASGVDPSPDRAEELTEFRQGALLPKNEDVMVAVELNQSTIGHFVQESLIASRHKRA